MKLLVIVIEVLVILAMYVLLAGAVAPTCALTGNLVHLYGSAAKNAKVFFTYAQAQNTGGSVVLSEQVMVITDANGNLPTSGGCLPSPGTQFCPPQGAYFYVQVGSASTKVQAPLMTTADLSTLILANTDPTSIVSAVASGNSACSVVNPSIGSIGTATITCQTTNIASYTGPISITGNGTNGSDSINSVNVNGVVNALTYGVACDGSTNNATALQNALNAACPGIRTGLVELPASCYGASGHSLVIGSTVTIPTQCGVLGLGGPGQAAGGMRAVEIDYTGNGVAFTTSTSSNSNGVRLSNFRLKNTGTGTVGIRLSGVFNAVVDGVLVDGGFTGAGISIASNTASSSNNDTIMNSQSYQNGYGLLLDGTADTSHNVGSISLINDAFSTATIADLYIHGFDSTNYTVTNVGFFGDNIAEGTTIPAITCTNGSTLGFYNTFIENVTTAFNLTNCLDVVSLDTNVSASGLTTYPIVADGLSTYRVELNKRSGWGYTVSNTTARLAYEEPTALQDPTGQVGLGQITNIALDSEDFSTANWTAVNITSRTANNATAPNGTMTATTVVTASGASLRQPISVGSAVGTRLFECSVWARVNSGIFNGFQANISDSPTNTIMGSSTANLSTTWQRIAVLGQGTGDTDTSIIFRPISQGSNTTLRLWGAQCHELPSVPLVASATSYVKTAGTAATGTNVGLSLRGEPIINAGTVSVSGGGALATGSNSYVGTVTSSAASGNVITPGFTCPTAVVCMLSDETTKGGANVTASNATTCTYSATASDTVDYLVSCRGL